jgi:hypothetical protein
MNETAFPELQSLRIEISDEVRDAQFESIVAALREQALPTTLAVGPAVSWWQVARRRWAVSLAAIGTALVPVAAVAAESSIPGDALYPVKLTVERIQVLFDGDVDAEHRVSDLEELLERDAAPVVIARHIVETDHVLDQTTDRVDLIKRYDDAVTDFLAREHDRPAVDIRPESGQTDRPTERGDRTRDEPRRDGSDLTDSTARMRDSLTEGTEPDGTRDTTTTHGSEDTTTTPTLHHSHQPRPATSGPTEPSMGSPTLPLTGRCHRSCW